MPRKTAEITNPPTSKRTADYSSIEENTPEKGDDYKLFEEWLYFCKVDGLENKTLKGYRHNVGWFLWWWHHTGYADKLGAHPENVTVKEAREYAAYLREPVENRWGIEKSKSTLSSATVGNYSRPIKIWFNWMEREGHIRASPFNKSVRFITRKPDKTIKYVKVEDLDKLFAFLTNSTRVKTYVGCRDLAMITLFLDSGIRLGEMLSIKLKELDMVRLRCKISGKTGSRHALFSEKCREALNAYLKLRKPQGDLDGQLWYTGDGYPLTHDAMVSTIRRVGYNSGVQFHPHMLRHTFGLLMSKKVSAFELKEMMGHESLKTTEIYVQQNVDLLVESYRPNAPMTVLSDRLTGMEKKRPGRPKNPRS